MVLQMKQENINGISADQLKALIEKLENLEQDKEELMITIRDVFAEAKSNGFDVKVIRQLLKIRRMKKEELAQQEELLHLYRKVLGE